MQYFITPLPHARFLSDVLLTQKVSFSFRPIKMNDDRTTYCHASSFIDSWDWKHKLPVDTGSQVTCENTFDQKRY
jgi:hypothetical protein